MSNQNSLYLLTKQEESAIISWLHSEKVQSIVRDAENVDFSVHFKKNNGKVSIFASVEKEDKYLISDALISYDSYKE